jgi:hypothetical protein
MQGVDEMGGERCGKVQGTYCLFAPGSPSQPSKRLVLLTVVGQNVSSGRAFDKLLHVVVVVVLAVVAVVAVGIFLT